MRSQLRQDDYRGVLRDELATRCNANPRYSQSAFARDLAIPAHRLSEVLSGKQGLSRDAAAKVADRLGFSKRELGYFCDLVESRHGRSPLKRRLALLRIEEIKHGRASRRLVDDVFHAIADWHHFAILELTTLKGFKSDTKWIATALGLKPAQVEQAVDRLLALELLVRKNDRLSATSASDFAPGGIPSEAIRRFHAQVLAKAHSALFTRPLPERQFTTSFVGIPADGMAEAKVLIQEFVAGFGAKVRQDHQAEVLYALGVQFFQLNEVPS